MFGRKDSSDNPSAEQPIEAPVDSVLNPAEAKKGRPTPKRSAQQEARRQPLVGGDRKAANKKARSQIRKQREEARLGMMNGEERYLGPRDKGPQRRYVRDFVDARTSVSEFFIPIAFVVLIVGLLQSRDVQMFANVIVYGLFAIVVLDSIFLNWQMKSRMKAKYGADKLERGLTFYAVMRNIQMRKLRIPKPQVKRGQYPA